MRVNRRDARPCLRGSDPPQRRRNHNAKTVKELLRTNDPVEISWVCALLADAGIEAAVFDAHTSVVEGSIGAIPRRVTVADEDFAAARRILDEAGVD